MSYLDELIDKQTVEQVPATQPVEQVEQQVEEAPSYEPGEPMFNVFRNNAEKPKEPDQKKLQNNMRVASIAQALGVLADSFAAGQGAYVKERNTNAVQPVAERNRRLREIYEQKLEQYNRAGLSAMYQDAANKESWAQRKYLKEQADADKKEQREYDEGQRIKTMKENQEQWIQRNKTEMENFKTKLGLQKKYTEHKEEKLTPTQQVEIDREFAKIPVEYLQEYGYVVRKTREIPNPVFSSAKPVKEEYFEPVNLDHDRKLAVIKEYNSRVREPSKQPKAPTLEDYKEKTRKDLNKIFNPSDPLGLF